MADMPMSELIAQASSNAVVVHTPRAAALAQGLVGPDVTVASPEPDTLEITGLTCAQVGDRAHELDIPLHGLALEKASLEEAFMEMTRDEVEYHATTPTHHTIGTAA